jgi:eukaryotic-like serine/threonine-protein kinase
MPAIGDLLADRYRIDTRLGAGGMGTVWRAHDLRLDRDVAVKVLMPSFADDPVLTERFDREARALAAVASPHVIAIHDVVTTAGSDPFLVMELCPDGSLGDRLDAAGALAVAVALPLLADAAEGLVALHARGILHRDVTPRNVLLSGGRAKLGDLGLARTGGASERPPLTELTATGTTVGTLAYLAPELLEGKPPSAASDVYGLGAVAYRTLSGVLPHAAGNVAELVSARLLPVAPLGEHLPGVAPALASLVARALDVRPGARPSAAEMATGLRNLAVSAGGPGPSAAMAAGGIAAGPGAGGPAGATGPDAPTRAAIATLSGVLDTGDRSRPATPIPSRPGRGADRYRGPSLWTGEILLVAIVAVIVLLVLLAIAGAFGGGPSTPPGSSGPAPSPSASPAESPLPSASPSLPPSPIADPFAVAAARAAEVRAAIDAARGPGALKGKESKQLSDLLDQVAGALAGGDAAGATTATGRLATQVQAYVSDGIVAGEPGQALEAAVRDLVTAVASFP